VAFAWQSGHRPLQRATTYGFDGAFPSQLQPSLLRVYEYVSNRWYEFIKQPSKRMSRGRDLGRVSSAKQAQPGNKLVLQKRMKGRCRIEDFCGPLGRASKSDAFGSTNQRARAWTVCIGSAGHGWTMSKPRSSRVVDIPL
jgi:hypothetical protein